MSGTMIHVIDAARVTQTRFDGFATEASDLGWAPGFYPPLVGVGRDVFAIERFGRDGAVYRCGARELVVFND